MSALLKSRLLVPGAEGRTLQVRPALRGQGVQLGIVGKRGSLVEAFCADLAQVPQLVLGIDAVSEWAWEEFNRHVDHRPVEVFGREW